VPKKQVDEQPNDGFAFEFEQIKKLADDNLNLAKYHKAEFENFKKRNQDAVSNAYRDGKEIAIVQFLPLVDSLHEAYKSVETENDRLGVEILIRKFGQIMVSLGAEEISAIGQPFDPNIHNAVAVEAVEGKPADIVLEEWQKGYKLNGKMIRPSTVKVSK